MFQNTEGWHVKTRCFKHVKTGWPEVKQAKTHKNQSDILVYNNALFCYCGCIQDQWKYQLCKFIFKSWNKDPVALALTRIETEQDKCIIELNIVRQLSHCEAQKGLYLCQNIRIIEDIFSLRWTFCRKIWFYCSMIVTILILDYIFSRPYVTLTHVYRSRLN